jgi:indolepyruvate ferredoxin oxidoreductase
VGVKTTSDTVDTATSIDADPGRLNIVMPRDFAMPPGGLNICLPDPWREQAARQTRYKLAAAQAFARANRLDRTLIASPRSRLAIIASGKAALDVQQALFELGLDAAVAARLGIALLKIAMPYPLDGDEVRAFARGAKEVLVVEENRRVVETQVKDALYTLPEGERPRVVGRTDENGAVLVPEIGELTPDGVAPAIARRLASFHTSEQIAARITFLDAKAKAARARQALPVVRTTTFCSGCPHNTSTRLPEGSRAHGGVGCHFMAVYMDRNTSNHTHMGGEGATWVGQAPFVETDHIFQNLGDGTYYHSGLLGIRACVAAGTNITFKILFNDAVAMTGGQPHDGPLTPALISQQVYAEGVRKIVVISDEPNKYPKREAFAPDVTFEHRKALDRIQKELRRWLALASSSTTRPVRRKSGGGASVVTWMTRRDGCSSTRRCARAAAIATSGRAVCRCCRWIPSSGANGRSTNRHVTRTTPVPTASAPASLASSGDGHDGRSTAV